MMRMLSHDALIESAVALDYVVKADALAKAGRQVEALALMAALAKAAEAILPVIRGVISTQEKAAEAMDLTHHTLAPFFRPVREHADTANSEPPDERIEAIAEVLNGHSERRGRNGLWRVFWEDGRLIFEPTSIANDHDAPPETAA